MNKQTVFLSLIIFTLILFGLSFTIDDETKLQMAMSAERSIAGLDQKSVQVGNHKIEYLEGGQGDVILMIHGFGANKDNWLRFAKYFTESHRVIIPDLPGFGESTVLENESYDADNQATRLKEFLDTLNIPEAHITGNSMGGYIAAQFSSKYPETAVSAWLLNPLGVQDAEPSEMFKMFSQGLHPYVLPRNEKEFKLLMSKVFHSQPYTPEFVIRALNKDFQRHYPSNERIAFDIHKVKDGKIQFSYPIEESLKNYKNPLLVIWGDDDRILSADGLRAIKERRPETTAIMMKNMGHAPMIEAPGETADLIKKFLKESVQ